MINSPFLNLESFFNNLNIQLDDLILLGVLYFLYSEQVDDKLLYVILFMLLLSWFLVYHNIFMLHIFLCVSTSLLLFYHLLHNNKLVYEVFLHHGLFL